MTRDERNAYSREWAAKNPDKIHEAKRKSREKHRESNAARRRAYRLANREQLIAQKEKWDRENPERVAAARAIAMIRRKAQQLERHLRWHYDFAVDDYLALLAAQGGCCAICGAEKGNDRGHRLYLDHDHTTGRIRGLLCSKCNSAIGYFSDSAERLRAAAAYLERQDGTNTGHERRIQQVLAGLPAARGEGGRSEGMAASGPIGGPCGGDPGRLGVADGAGFLA